MVSFRLGEKRSIGAAGNAASGHKMFIAAGSDFSGGKVWCESENGDEADAEMRTAAQTGGGSRSLCSGIRFCYFTFTRMKNELPASAGGDALNRAFPSIGFSMMSSTPSAENVA